MVQTKKKRRPLLKKDVKSVAKKKSKSVTKKASKTSVKRKKSVTAKKKTKNPVRKKVAAAVNKKNKSKVVRKRNREMKIPVEAPVPEVIRQEEAVHPVPVYNEMHPQTMEEHKKFERRRYNRDNVIMNQENQKVKSALASRLKRVFRTPRS